MDYEKKYKEVLEKARKLRGEYNEIEGWYSNQWLCEELFPELAESEDERIRKVLVGWVNIEPLSSFEGGFTKEDILAWLEKQKEQKPVDTSEIEMKRHNEGYVKGVHDAYDNVNQARSILNQLRRERPKQEWSEEDENCYNEVVRCIEQSTQSSAAEHGLLTWLKSLRLQKQWKPSDEQMKALETILYTNMSRNDERYSVLSELVEELKKLRY